ncbi:MAG: LysM peptidoglycan-binding domain-containing protein [Tannerellaceae bacterium]|nr:LysM peptidoglycan-binding domain-containing protein [Tannerellaceae bacterium]
MRGGDLVMDITVVPGGEEIYEVKAGENLSRIAAKYPGMTWKKIFEANKDKLKDPDLIYPGQKLTIPL